MTLTLPEMSDAEIDAFCTEVMALCVRTGVHPRADLDLLAEMMGLPEDAPVTCILDEIGPGKPAKLIGRVMAASKGRLDHATVARVVNEQAA